MLDVPLAESSPAVVPLPFGRVRFTAGPADAITTLLLSEGAPPTATISGLAVRPEGTDTTG